MLCYFAKSSELVAMVHQGYSIAEMINAYVSEKGAYFACREKILQGKMVKNQVKYFCEESLQARPGR
jgi:hypothetical protein